MKPKVHERLKIDIMLVSKRVFLAGFLAMVAMGLFAQSVDKAKDLLKAGKIAEAKEQIDNALTKPKEQKNAEAWYYQLKVYNAIAANDQLRAQYPEARDTAFIALKKYVDLDEKDKKLLLLQLDGYKPVNEIYQGYFQVGAADYNTGKYIDALKNFEGAIDASSYMTSKGWTKLPIDTTSTLYAGISAEKAGKKDTAAYFYGKLADAGISSINGTNMIDIYKWLVDYWNNKKDDANTEKFLREAETKYPDDLFWPSTRLDILREKGNKDSLWNEYDSIVAHFPKNHLFAFNYGLELYQYANDTSSGHRPANYDSLIARAERLLKKCLELQPDYPQAALVLGQIYYNAAIDLQAATKKIPGKAPEDIKKRADLRIAAQKKFDQAIPYFEQVDKDLGSQGKLKMDQKNALKDAYDLLTNIYTDKNIKDKIDYWTNKYNNVDKDH
jgi:tetratricopeptide repeat protein